MTNYFVESIIIIVVFALIMGCLVAFDYYKTTLPVQKECQSFGFPNAFHGTGGWYCTDYKNESGISYNLLKLRSGVK
jgi:hypothetical protein